MLRGEQVHEASAAASGVRTIVTGNVADEVLTPDGTSLLVSDTGGTVTRYDLATGAATGSWHLANSLGGMSVSPDGHYLYAADPTPVSSSGTTGSMVSTAAIHRVDLGSGATDTIQVQLPNSYAATGLNDVVATADGHLLLTQRENYVSGFDPVLSLDLSNNSLNVGHSSIAEPVGLVSTTDGAHVVATSTDISFDPVYIINSQGDATATHSEYADGTGGFKGLAAISADGNLVAQASGYSQANLLLYNGSLQLLHKPGETAQDVIDKSDITALAFSPDAATLYVLEAQAHKLFALSTADLSFQGVISIGSDLVPPTYGGDNFGDRLLVSADGHYLTVEGSASVEVIDLTQVSPGPLLTTLTFPTTVSVNPDGGSLYITAGAIDGASPVQTVTITLDHALPTSTGDVTEITFSADHDSFDDTFSAVNLALTGAASGTYTVIGATLTDAAGHTSSYDATALDAFLPSDRFTVISEQSLTEGDDTYHDTYGQGLTVHGLGGNDTLYGSSSQDTLDGGAGNDTLVQGLGATDFIGGDGVDTVVLNGNAHDYYEVHDADGGIGMLARNGSANEFISSDVEQVRFADGSYLSADNEPDSDYGSAVSVTGDYTIHAPATGLYQFNGGAGDNAVFLPGNVSDYTLSRDYIQTGNGYIYKGSLGDFDLSAKDGSAAYAFSESVDSIHFANGQYLALKDLPAYISGDATLASGGDQNDILFQTKASGVEAFYGGAGHDDLYLKGNVSDYSVRDFFGYLESGEGRISGVELLANNSSGALFIDNTVDTIHFQNGQSLAFGDVQSSVAAAPASDAVYHVLSADYQADEGYYYGISGAGYANDILMLDGNAGDYSIARNYEGAFVLQQNNATSPSSQVVVGQDIETVEFQNGQYLALHDLPAYLSGDASFTRGSSADDILLTPLSGDQYVYGGAGQDNLYLHGNVNDYTLQQVNSVYDPHSGTSITGVELIADNGSGNIYIDQSVETVHFQNGQYLAFNDLHSYIG